MTNPSSPPQFGEWMPIETAPAVEFIHTVLIARNDGKRCVVPAFFDGEHWRMLSIAGAMVFQNPTHWMPLPPAPASQGDENDD